MRVDIYTDGGADPNPGIGGWAALLKAGGREKVLTGNEPWTTNNRMELTAAIEAFKALTRRSTVHVHTDSEYLQKGITEWAEGWRENNWQRKGKKIPNADLWKDLLLIIERHDVEWHWVRGHSGNRSNERVDRLARQARLEITEIEVLSSDIPVVYSRVTVKGNPGPGAWGVVVDEHGDTSQYSGYDPRTTSNRMELIAVLEGLRLVPEGGAAVVVTTSDYVYQGATRWINGWRRRAWRKKDGKPIANMDLWQELDEILQKQNVIWKSGKGIPDQYEQGLIEAAKVAGDAIALELS